jgi:hypothetical protein
MDRRVLQLVIAPWAGVALVLIKKTNSIGEKRKRNRAKKGNENRIMINEIEKQKGEGEKTFLSLVNSESIIAC